MKAVDIGYVGDPEEVNPHIVEVISKSDLIPVIAPQDAGLTQIHSAQYYNPQQLPEGAVLVVGAGSSGVQIADELLASILADLPYGPGDEVAVLVNGLGATPKEELYLLYRRSAQILAERRHLDDEPAGEPRADAVVEVLIGGEFGGGQDLHIGQGAGGVEQHAMQVNAVDDHIGILETVEVALAREVFVKGGIPEGGSIEVPFGVAQFAEHRADGSKHGREQCSDGSYRERELDERGVDEEEPRHEHRP